MTFDRLPRVVMPAAADDRDGFHRRGRAGMFTVAATDTEQGLGGGQPQSAGECHRLYRLRRAFVGTSRTRFAGCLDQTPGGFKMYDANSRDPLLGQIEQTNRTAGADLAAAPAIEIAGAPVEIQTRLEQRAQAIFPEGRL